MRIKLNIDWVGPTKGEPVRQHKAGDEIDVLLLPGTRLLRRRQAKWISGHPEDQGFVPVEPFRLRATPQHDKMVRGVLNK